MSSKSNGASNGAVPSSSSDAAPSSKPTSKSSNSSSDAAKHNIETSGEHVKESRAARASSKEGAHVLPMESSVSGSAVGGNPSRNSGKAKDSKSDGNAKSSSRGEGLGRLLNSVESLDEILEDS